MKQWLIMPNASWTSAGFFEAKLAALLAVRKGIRG
jgi:hypothetical protein